MPLLCFHTFHGRDGDTSIGIWEIFECFLVKSSASQQACYCLPPNPKVQCPPSSPVVTDGVPNDGSLNDADIADATARAIASCTAQVGAPPATCSAPPLFAAAYPKVRGVRAVITFIFFF